MSNAFLSMRLKGLVVTPKAVTSRTDRELRNRLHNFGRYVRQTAKRSMRKRKKSSEPGKPPSAHEGMIKKKMVYAVDMAAKNVVIGPMLYSRRMAHVVEYGGDPIVLLRPWWPVSDPVERFRIERRIRARGDNPHARRHRVRRRIKYEARPFMRPAFKKEIEANSKLWKDLI